jgi:hypothetical protein
MAATLLTFSCGPIAQAMAASDWNGHTPEPASVLTLPMSFWSPERFSTQDYGCERFHHVDGFARGTDQKNVAR